MCLRFSLCLSVYRFRHTSGTSARNRIRLFPLAFFFGLICHDSLMVIGRGLPLLKSYSSCRTCRKTVAQTVAVVFSHKFSFSQNHTYGAFMTCTSAGSASVTFLLVYLYNLSNHIVNLHSLLLWSHSNIIHL